MTKQHIPKIRFQGFDDEWEETKLDDLGKSSSGTAIEKFFSAEGDFKVVSIGSYSEENTYKDQGIRAVLNEKTKNRILNKNDLTMILNDKTSSGNIIGRVLLIDEDNTYVYNQRTQRIQLDSKYYPIYIYQMLNADINRNKLIRTAQGNTQIYVNWSDISKMEYSLPSLPEQESIGQLFRTLDDLISAYKENLEQYQSLKTSMLSKMFPKEGQKQPEIRLDGFDGDWEEKELSNLGSRVKSYSLTRDYEIDYKSGIKYIHYGDIHTGKALIIENNNSLPYIKNDERFIEYLQQGDLVFVDASEDYKGIANVCLIKDAVDDNIIAGLHTIAFRMVNEMSSLYMFYLFKTSVFKKFGYKVGTGMKVFGISVNNLLSFNVYFPSLPEQEAIGAFFANLDETISFYQDKIGQLELLKKNLLSQMFI